MFLQNPQETTFRFKVDCLLVAHGFKLPGFNNYIVSKLIFFQLFRFVYNLTIGNLDLNGTDCKLITCKAQVTCKMVVMFLNSHPRVYILSLEHHLILLTLKFTYFH
jgi:hypothetical protein